MDLVNEVSLDLNAQGCYFCSVFFLVGNFFSVCLYGDESRQFSYPNSHANLLNALLPKVLVTALF